MSIVSRCLRLGLDWNDGNGPGLWKDSELTLPRLQRHRDRIRIRFDSIRFDPFGFEEEFRSRVDAGQKGWGRKSELNLENIKNTVQRKSSG